MKRPTILFFPFFFAILSLLSFSVIEWIRSNPVDPLLAGLIFAAALAWSAMIAIPVGKAPWLKLAMIILALVGAVLGVEFFSDSSQAIGQYRIIYELIILGVIMIKLYFLILKKKDSA